MKNHDLITRGFENLLSILQPFVTTELKSEYGSYWWTDAVLTRLLDKQRVGLPTSGDDETVSKSLDIERCLILIDIHWKDIFSKKLSKDHRTWCNELKGTRNKWAHIGTNDFNDSDTFRALDTMTRVCEGLDAIATENLRALMRESRYGSADGSLSATVQQSNKRSEGVLTTTPATGLKSWRNVISPHPDVAQGRYKNAEFAADLSLVARGEGSIEYKDPVEFFSRTYITEGMKGLLVQSLKRIVGKDGEPVIQLKTAFGGGKTHSMLALYHLLRGGFPLEKVPSVRPVLNEAGISDLPKVNVAVLVGTALDPAKSKRPQQLPGVTVNTLWGEIAAQLAVSAHRPEIYDLIKEADKKAVSPGSETLTKLLDSCGPCLILIDELVAYARKIFGVSGLPAGSFENIITFIQEITEAARASKNSIVVASIPESENEIGGESGQKTLEAIEHTFGRMEAIWKPVAADEGFEIVRRRLFLDCQDVSAREAVCDAYAKMYYESTNDFPIETKELDYKRRLINCYPIHPEIFDRLYEDWATLEKFQRTRGVLRLMAAVIHNLWINNDMGLMIMPGSISMAEPTVRDELTRHLTESWNSIVDSEVDGKSSAPYKKDATDTRYGQRLACRRVARTIMLGSAPTINAQKVRGIELARIMLGVAQPGENVTVFRDALFSVLSKELSYLYSDTNGSRFWYDTRPTLRKTASDRISQQSDEDVTNEITKQLHFRVTEPFGGIHSCPASSLDVPDEQVVRLVILKPEYTWSQSADNKAEQAALDILKNRGTSPRIYRNMLVFVAPDAKVLKDLQDVVKEYLAWMSIERDTESLNLDQAQIREVSDNIKRTKDTIAIRIKETYCHLLVPSIDPEVSLGDIIWTETRLSGSNDDIPRKAAVRLEQNEDVISVWNPQILCMKLNQYLWKDKPYIQIKQLWDNLTKFCYLPRLANYNVLKNAILKGLQSEDYFGIADGESDGTYFGLKFGCFVGDVDTNSVLVKASVAKAEKERKQKEMSDVVSPVTTLNETQTTFVYPEEPKQQVQENEQLKNKHFGLSTSLDLTRINRDVSNLVEEVITHLQQTNKSHVTVRLEVSAETDEGFSQETVRTVSANCKTLKITDFDFSK